MIKKILISGGAGFLGSHLCKKLLDEGHKIICIDNFLTSSKQNIIQLMNNSRFELLDQDITSPINIKVDEIYNLACPASPIHYQSDPVKTIKTCVIGAINLLDLAKKNNTKILQASTSEVYGDPDINPQPESYRGLVNPIGIRACYDEGKRCAETLFFDYYRQYNLKIKVVRIFNTYGPNMHRDDGRVVSNFIIQALKNEDITIYGTGEQTRSFCYVDDLIDGMVRMMNSKDDFIGPVNIGNPKEYTILQLASKIVKLTNSNSDIVNLALPEDDPMQRRPDISLAKDKLSWIPNIKLEDGLIKTINYFKDELEINKDKI